MTIRFQEKKLPRRQYNDISLAKQCFEMWTWALTIHNSFWALYPYALLLKGVLMWRRLIIVLKLRRENNRDRTTDDCSPMMTFPQAFNHAAKVLSLAQLQVFSIIIERSSNQSTKCWICWTCFLISVHWVTTKAILLNQRSKEAKPRCHVSY